MATIDVDRETAHEAAARELAKPMYPESSLTGRITDWLNDFLQRLIDSGTALPGGWLTIVVLGLLVLAVVAAAIRTARRTMGGRRGHEPYKGRVLTAADHRTRAEQFAARGDWTAAIRQRVRAIGRQLEEDSVLNPVAGRTAGELAAESGRALPALAGQFASAATAFNDVTYGERPGTEGNYRLVCDLDDRLSSARRTPGPTDLGSAAR